MNTKLWSIIWGTCLAIALVGAVTTVTKLQAEQVTCDENQAGFDQCCEDNGCGAAGCEGYGGCGGRSEDIDRINDAIRVTEREVATWTQVIASSPDPKDEWFEIRATHVRSLEWQQWKRWQLLSGALQKNPIQSTD